LVYTAEENAPENDRDDAFAKFRFLPELRRGIHRTKEADVVHRSAVALRRIRVCRRCAIRRSNSQSHIRSWRRRDANTFGQAQFVTDDTLLATGFEVSEDGKRLGVRVCFN
jgi:acylaminoacyl-peptidase